MGLINVNNIVFGTSSLDNEKNLAIKFSAEISEYINNNPTSGNIWSWIQNRISAGNYDGINVGDYMPLSMENGARLFKMQVAGIDTYTNNGDVIIPHHIDFISEELYPENRVFNLVNYNSGLRPNYTFTGNGTDDTFYLPEGYVMNAIQSVTIDDVPQMFIYPYQQETGKIKIGALPAEGATIVVTGTGSDSPWISSDLYAYLNSQKNHVPNGTTTNPEITIVDYTLNGVYNKLPLGLKNVITNKRVLVPTKNSTTSTLVDDNSWEWLNIGNLWLPFASEIYGYPVYGRLEAYTSGFAQYPIFASASARTKFIVQTLEGQTPQRAEWWTPTTVIRSSLMCITYGGTSYPRGASALDYFPICFRIAGV